MDLVRWRFDRWPFDCRRQQQLQRADLKKGHFYFPALGTWTVVENKNANFPVANCKRSQVRARSEGAKSHKRLPCHEGMGWVGIALRIVFGQWPVIFGRFFALRICQCTRPPLQGGRASWLRLRSGWTSMHANLLGNVCFAWWAFRVARRAMQDECCGEVQA